MKQALIFGATTLAAVGVLAGVTAQASAQYNGDSKGNGTQQHEGAKGRYGKQTSLESRAQVVGMTAIELEAALETKTMSQIAADKGMTQADFEAKMQSAAQQRWESRGLSDDEIAKRLADREQRQTANQADHEFGSGNGMHRGNRTQL